MFSTLLSLLGSARIERGVDSVTLDSEVFDESGLSGGKLPGKNSIGLQRLIPPGVSAGFAAL